MNELSGLLVVSVEHAVAAPYASAKLADAGARVVKVERPEGDFARGYDALVNGDSAYFVWLNRGKQSVRLDLKADGDRAVLAGLIAKADVVIQNLGPGVMKRLGFGAEDLLAARPDLIVCSITGYGADGPRAAQKAYDLLIQAESGICAINGTPEGPARVGVSICDIAAGMNAYQAILEALIGRGITGKGRIIDVSLFHAMAEMMNVPYLQHRYGGFNPGRHGLMHPSIAPYGAFPCADGKALLLSVQNDREWRSLCTAMDRPDLAVAAGFATNTERVANRTQVDGIVAAHMAAHGREDNIALLDTARIAYGRLSDLSDLAEHPQNRMIAVEAPHGTVEMMAPGARVRGETRAYGPVPALDADGDAIRAEFSPD